MKNRKYIIIGGLALVVNLVLIGFLYWKNKQEDVILKNIKVLEPDQTDLVLAPKKRLATFVLSSDTSTIKKGSMITINVRLSSQETLLGADAVILYNPKFISVKKLESGNMFPNYPRVLNEPKRGRIVITGININNKQLVSNLFAVIKIRVLKSGSANISFVYQPKTQKGSTAIRANDGKNILTHVEDLQILIQ